jgi:hypothetical protein
MKTLDQIMKEAEAKAQSLSTEISKRVDPTHPDVDDVLQKVINEFLEKESRPRKIKATARKTSKAKSKSTAGKPRKPRTLPVRLTFVKIVEVYEKTRLNPFKAEYWFYEDRKSRPLVQVSTLNDERTHATPLSAYTLMKREELLNSENPPTFITEYRDLDRPSNTWTAGRISQISGLDMSYILGFRSGSDGNKPGHPRCSARYHAGYEDGLAVRNRMIEEKMIEPDPKEDIYADEDDEGVLNELHRVRGYWRSEWDNNGNS